MQLKIQYTQEILKKKSLKRELIAYAQSYLKKYYDLYNQIKFIIINRQTDKTKADNIRQTQKQQSEK